MSGRKGSGKGLSRVIARRTEFLVLRFAGKEKEQRKRGERKGIVESGHGLIQTIRGETKRWRKGDNGGFRGVTPFRSARLQYLTWRVKEREKGKNLKKCSPEVARTEQGGSEGGGKREGREKSALVLGITPVPTGRTYLR